VYLSLSPGFKEEQLHNITTAVKCFVLLPMTEKLMHFRSICAVLFLIKINKKTNCF